MSIVFSPSGIRIENCPFLSEMVPRLLPFTRIVAEGSVIPFSSWMTPFIVRIVGIGIVFFFVIMMV